jgi:hypothetical protein
MSDALYAADGDRFVPSDLTTGPWDPAAQHGGAPAALLTHLVEQVPTPEPAQIARLTFELMRPVPLAPLRATTDVVRPGRKVQLVQASLHAEGADGAEVEVMRATALRIRRTELDLPEGVVPDDPPPLGPEHGQVLAFPGGPRFEGTAYHSHANDIRFVAGGFDRPGPATAWIRLLVPVVDGRPTSPLMRVAGAADFGNGLSWTLPRLEWIFINPDLTVHVTREPTGEWVGLDATTHPEPTGIGLAESALYDSAGRIGRAVQSLLLDTV